MCTCVVVSKRARVLSGSSPDGTQAERWDTKPMLARAVQW